MATRFYLPSTGAAPISPAFSSDWAGTGTADRLVAVLTKIGSATASKSTALTSGKQLARQYVYGPIGAGTISGTIKGQVRTSRPVSGIIYVALGLRVVKPDLSDRGVLLAVTLDTLSAGASLTNRNALVSTAITSVTAVNGDYLVFEYGDSSNAARALSISFGDNTTDLPEDTTTTTALDPWLEFSGAIPAYVAGTTNSGFFKFFQR